MSIEIIMATYNASKFLNAQLESLFSQTNQDFKVIIRDNHSSDNTPQLLQDWEGRHPEKIRVFYGDKNIGVIGNFAFLLEQTKAPYVMFSDADDVWLPNKIEKTLKLMRQQEERWGKNTPLLVHTDLQVVDGSLNLVSSSFWGHSRLRGDRNITLNRALTENVITGCTMMINRALADLATPIPLEVAMHDAWLGLAASAFGKVVPLREATILYRQHGNNDTGAQRYGWFSLIKKIRQRERREKVAATRQKRRRQAEHFLHRYGDRLTKEQKGLIEIYLSVQKTSLIGRGYKLWKYDLFESGFLRKLFQLTNALP